jgi:predicted DNA-binding protein (MmcQ/YjbR family)
MVTVQEVRQWALALPDAVQLPHFEKDSFRIKKKIFATLDNKTNRLVVKLSEVDQSVFASHDASIIYPVPNKWGKQGYTIIELKRIRKDLCREVLRVSYENVLKPRRNLN